MTTPEQKLAKQKAQEFFGDLLDPANAAPPKSKVRNAVSPKLDKMWGSHVDSTILVHTPAFKPEIRHFTITKQICTTCGAVHEYISTAFIRYHAFKRRDNLRISLPESVPNALDLPHEITYAEERTEICPTCVHNAETISDVIEPLKHNQQMELFS